MIGGGHRFDDLINCVNARELGNMGRFLPYQERAALNRSLGVPDLHWISLKPELEGSIVPSKVYGVAAAGRPMIAIADAAGDIARLVRRHGCGIVITPGDADGLAAALRRLADDSPAVADMGCARHVGGAFHKATGRPMMGCALHAG